MTIATSNGLVELLRECRLLDAGQLQSARELQSRFADPRVLAGELMRRNWLTAYQVNQLFAGRGAELQLGSYTLLERLGEGGMGTVFKARHQIMSRVVALKVIRKDKFNDPEAIRRFGREIRAAAQLVHPNIVTAYDADQVGDRHFFVMEYVEGTNLAQLVHETGPLPLEQACAYVRQTALGLQHAHDKGMVHRDIKPSNLLLAMKEGQVKILDMGLARIGGQPESADTPPSGTPMGTPDYEAPEQARHSHQVDIRADLYSLGCTFYFLLTGRPPFPGGTASEKLVRHQLDQPDPVEKLNPEVPVEVGTLIRRLLAKRPEDRCQTPAELLAALAQLRCLQKTPTWAALTVRSARSLTAPLWRQNRRRRGPILVLLVLLGLGLAVFLMLHGPRVHPVLGYPMKNHLPNAVDLEGHWFAFFPDRLSSWEQARARCQEMGGYLACIKTPARQQLIVKLSRGQPAWLGGSCTDPRKWLWLTGEPINATHWAAGQPNSGQNAVLQLLDGAWHDIGPNEQRGYAAGFICEWEE